MPIERRETEIVHTGQRKYFSKVVWKLADEDKGKMVVIDVDSGDYEVDASEKKAVDRLLARKPDACTWAVEFQGRPMFHGGWRMTYPNGYTIEGGTPSRDEVREAIADARRRPND